jgi:teichuronic acid biosynthesis glycosyltransferase TuaC
VVSGAHPSRRDAVFFSALDLALIPMVDTAFGRYAFPQKTYEIMACGTPLLTTRVGALAQTLAYNPSCLYAHGDPSELDARIAAQLAAPTLPSIAIPSWRDQTVRLENFVKEHA